MLAGHGSSLELLDMCTAQHVAHVDWIQKLASSANSHGGAGGNQS